MNAKAQTKIRPSEDELLAVNDVATYCKVHRAAVYRWMRDGSLPFITVGQRRRVRLSDLTAFLDQAS